MSPRGWALSMQAMADGEAVGRPETFTIATDSRPEPIPVIEASNILAGCPYIPTDTAAMAESDLYNKFHEGKPWAEGERLWQEHLLNKASTLAIAAAVREDQRRRRP